MVQIHQSPGSSKTLVASDLLHLDDAASLLLSVQIDVIIEIQYLYLPPGAPHPDWVSAMVRTHPSFGSSKTIVYSDSLHLDDAATLSLLVQIDVFSEIQHQHPPPGFPHPDWVSAMVQIHQSPGSSKTIVASDSLHLHDAASLSLSVKSMYSLRFNIIHLGPPTQNW